MKSFGNISYILGFASLLAKAMYTPYDYEYTNENEVNIVGDKYYLIYVNNTFGEYKIFSDNSKNQKRQASQMFVDSLVDQINSLIINNKETYQNPEVLDEIEELSKLRKRNNEEYDFVYPISSVNNRVVLYGYLSDVVKNKVKTMDNVMECVENTASSSIDYYNTNDILNETHWNGIEIRQNADLHLSLISQGKYDNDIAHQYDTNYYYPASAGKDIDIVILDTSFNFGYSEFSNTNDRIVKCKANVENGRASTDNIDNYCGKSTIYHGEMVSDVAAGLKHGVANRANVYGISIPSDSKGKVEEADIIGGLQFIYENMIRPHKTVINISFSGKKEESAQFFQQYKSLINAITGKGGIVVVSAGNQGKNIAEFDQYLIPCEFDNVICVGGTQNHWNQRKKYVYEFASGSNYGGPVDIYAPFFVKTEIFKDNKVTVVDTSGTSFSTPIVAGMIATIMSDNPNIIYTRKTIYDKLYENGQSEVAYGDEVTGIFANNGKHIVYSKDKKYNGCGIYAGNIPCPDGKEPAKNIRVSPISGRCGYKYGKCSKPGDCCNEKGYCGQGANFCTNCQPLFGICY
eukprot:jgi/Orpsp1_1/1177150/evm.model.c7180000060376.3